MLQSTPATAESLPQVEAQIAQAQAKLNVLYRQSDAASNAYDQAAAQLASAQQTVASYRSQQAADQAVLAQRMRRLDSFVAANYTSGGLGSLAILGQSGGPATLLDQLSLTSEISRNESEAVAQASMARQDAQVAAAEASTALANEHLQTQRLDAIRRNLISEADSVVSMVHNLQATEASILSQQAAARAAARLRALAAQAAAARLAAQQAGNGGGGNVTGGGGTTGGTSGGGSTGGGGSVPNPPPGTSAAMVAVQWAYSAIGRPYVYGAAGPDYFDCSGLTMWAYAHAGVSLAHSSYAQYDEGVHVPTADLQPGDLLFFYGLGHVGIYVGHGMMIDAPHTGAVVELVPVSYEGAWYVGATRPT